MLACNWLYRHSRWADAHTYLQFCEFCLLFNEIFVHRRFKFFSFANAFRHSLRHYIVTHSVFNISYTTKGRFRSYFVAHLLITQYKYRNLFSPWKCHSMKLKRRLNLILILMFLEEILWANSYQHFSEMMCIFLYRIKLL